MKLCDLDFWEIEITNVYKFHLQSYGFVAEESDILRERLTCLKWVVIVLLTEKKTGVTT